MPDIRELIESTKAKLGVAAETEESAEHALQIFANMQGVTLGLQLKHIYGGTVPPEVVARRRAKNRRARRQRRGNQAAIRREARLAESRNRTYRRLGRFVTGSLDHLGLIADAEVVE
ncbi:hypothetical protein [Mycolicibacterium fortuitum]|uniref:hypothetical protein n=1 Tax=Mycolicibacterium fortuitum TaxID=1766 RepID=UPI0007EBB284|nr:hypothetical protein [Mycolicibacterium fortuitum]OBF77016.1 hypothetical protein A5751_22815 [Mycolicibacterium fortuitum]